MRNSLWFLSSYAPLWLILAIRFDSVCLRIALAALALLSTLALLGLLRRGAGGRGENDRVFVSGDAGAEVSGYIAAYLLPFLTTATPDLRDLVGYTIFVIVAGSVYVRSGLMQINPTVYLFGWKVLRASMPVGRVQITLDEESGDESNPEPVFKQLEKEVFVLSRCDRRIGEHLKPEQYSDRVYIDHGVKDA